MPTTTTDLVEIAVTAAQEKLASNPVLMDVTDRLAITRSFLILSTPSKRQVRTIAEEILDQIRAECGIEVERIEDRIGNHWILVDYGDLVVRVLADEEREYYALEKLWLDETITYLRKPHESSLALS